MARPDTQTQFAIDALMKRIHHGDHGATRLPGERQLAAELGLSRQTVRRAIRHLTDQGTIARDATGRLRIASPDTHDGDARGGTTTTRQRIIVCLRPPSSSFEVERWRTDIEKAVASRGAVTRSIIYEHASDTAISTALKGGYDGVFFHPRSRMQPWLMKQLREAPARVVVVDHDASPQGLRSVAVFPDAAERKLLEHLVTLGHRRIDCFNVHGHNSVIEARIGQWRRFLDQHGLDGELYSTETAGIEAARDELTALLRSGRRPGTALLCTTLYAAMGGMRALHEAGLRIGRDISLCVINDEGLGPFLIPSLTCLQSPSRVPYLRKAVDWMLGRADWPLPSLEQPKTAPLFIGESTGPAPA
ncbi:substrate-binding domain-containing protein [Geminisphaera colitermitum]|uniref:substrate-binding domain-containing protein n=1 Tax=Geminisphaera colitermitum TaxID=1148786 RepID=UPI0005BD26AD|nr:substrate-binding domain-containing protein [Geminisphaera colitermitum]